MLAFPFLTEHNAGGSVVSRIWALSSVDYGQLLLQCILELWQWNRTFYFLFRGCDPGYKIKGHTGCPKKNALLRLTGHRGHQEWTRDKSRVSFAKFRKFPFWWAQKLLIFVRKWLRKMRSKMPTPLEKRHECGSSWRYSFLSPFF